MLSDSAFALSCMRPDLIKTLEDAKASDKVYHILVGKFMSNPSAYQYSCLLYTSPSPRDRQKSRMPSSA